MAQIALYIDESTQRRLCDAAMQRKVSQSQFVADSIRRATDDAWPAAVLALAGSVQDFPLAEELRVGVPLDLVRDLPS